MKRSQINEIQVWAKKLLEWHSFRLPSFAYWSLDQWKENRDRLEIIKEVKLGWDITDYGGSDFEKLGSTLFTIRNGTESGTGTPYAEKIILLYEGQRLPIHCHKSKTEDIINRGGGTMLIRLYNSRPDGGVDSENDVQVCMDGIKTTVKAGEAIEVTRGNSISLTPGMYHLFWAKEGAGDLILGEVSSINDDDTDNYFAEAVSRFSQIEEDEPILHLLCNEYEKILR